MTMLEHTLLVDEFEVFVKRSRRRSLSLEITPLGIQARAPMRMSQKDIRSFVRSKRNWLHKHLHDRPKILEPFNMVDGCELPFKNKSLKLIAQVNKRGKVKAIDDHLYVPVQPSKLTIDQSIKNKILKWYRQESLLYFEALVSSLAPQMGLEPSLKIKVRDYKRRWGSCDSKGDLSFNWRLIMAPEEVTRYVAIHELAHCHEFNHSARFWRIVERHQADWRDQRDWLYQHSPQLYRL